MRVACNIFDYVFFFFEVTIYTLSHLKFIRLVSVRSSLHRRANRTNFFFFIEVIR